MRECVKFPLGLLLACIPHRVICTVLKCALWTLLPHRQRVRILAVPRSGGSFGAHMSSLKRSLVQELQFQGWLTSLVDILDYQEGEDEPDLLILLFQSQGRPGDEFPMQAKALEAYKSPILTLVVQDSEHTITSHNILPREDKWRGLQSVHVVPGQSCLHSCKQNQQMLDQLSASISQMTENPISFPAIVKHFVCLEFWPYMLDSAHILIHLFLWSPFPVSKCSRCSANGCPGPSKLLTF